MFQPVGTRLVGLGEQLFGEPGAAFGVQHRFFKEGDDSICIFWEKILIASFQLEDCSSLASTGNIAP